uniref:C-type lectin n=1 Tax=Spirinchus lanceolatus TaxID=136040 RepID=Q3LHY3_9TELE|nr:C-type lectin [Spirinchus lanceolatus]
MWTILLFLCAVFVQSGATGEKDDRNKRSYPSCPSDWIKSGERCYLSVSAPNNWVGAEQYCLRQGANLASVHSFSEYTFLQQLVGSESNGHPVTWIGGTDAFQDRVWFWSDGSSFDYAAWAAGEPNNYGGRREPCIEMNWGADHRWNDSPCDQELGFICSFKLC